MVTDLFLYRSHYGIRMLTISSSCIDMREETSNCNDLIEKTANALTDDTLRLLFISVQQNNIDLCIRYAAASVHACSAQDICSSQNSVRCFMKETSKAWTSYSPRRPLVECGPYTGIVKGTLAFFPHVWVSASMLPVWLSLLISITQKKLQHVCWFILSSCKPLLM